MTKQQLQTIGLDETATEEEINARLAELATPRPQAETINGHLIPSHLNAARVKERFKTLQECGTAPDIAAKLAVDAEESQAIRDRENGVAPAL